MPVLHNASRTPEFQQEGKGRKSTNSCVVATKDSKGLVRPLQSSVGLPLVCFNETNPKLIPSIWVPEPRGQFQRGYTVAALTPFPECLHHHQLRHHPRRSLSV